MEKNIALDKVNFTKTSFDKLILLYQTKEYHTNNLDSEIVDTENFQEALFCNKECFNKFIIEINKIKELNNGRYLQDILEYYCSWGYQDGKASNEIT